MLTYVSVVLAHCASNPVGAWVLPELGAFCTPGVHLDIQRIAKADLYLL